MTFTRFAIYYAPPAKAGWTRFATAWLGWDMEAGRTVAHPEIGGLPVAEISQTPRKYGLHGTIKPPFRLADGMTLDGLQQAVAALGADLAPVSTERLHLARLGRFLALRPSGETPALNALAARCVRELDAFRAPAGPEELARRRAGGLTDRQEANLVQWGYPYVMEDFRFHITLTGRLPKHDLAPVERALEQALSPALPDRFTVPDLALVGEAEDGRFHLIHRYTLSG